MGFFEGLDPNSAQWYLYFSDTFYWLGIMFWFLLGLGIVFLFWYIITFNIPTHVYELVGKEKMLRFLRKTRARLKTKDQVTFMQIFGVKQKFPPPRPEDYQLSRKGKLLNVLKEGAEFRPFVISPNPGHITIQDMDNRFWLMQTIRDESKKYTEQSFMQKYGHYMAFIFGLLVLGWMYYVLIQQIGADIDKNLAISQQVADAMKTYVTKLP